MHRVVGVLLPLLGPLVLTGCGGDEPVPAGGAHNQADVAFASQMIPHHAQALELVELAESRGSSGAFGGLLEDIEAAQAPEIEQLSSWLAQWGEDVPATDEPASMAGGAGTDGMGAMAPMPGMITSSARQRLEATRGEAFQQLWLRLMIEHHEGAVQMARDQVRQGESEAATALADDIIETQLSEVELMEELLRR